MAEVPPDPALDLALVQKALARHPAAVAALAERLQCVPRILNGLNARLGRVLDEHDLADTVQDTMVTLLGKLQDYAGQGVLEAWAFRICSFQLMNAVRRRRRQALLARELDDSRDDEVAVRVWRQILAREALETGIERIGGFEAVALRLKHFDGLSFDEMAAHQGISRTAMKARYYRAMARLEEWITAQESREDARELG